MAYKTSIEWTDSTWNPITGCQRVSKGCERCYAETLAATRLKNHSSRKGLTDENGRWNGVVRLNEQWLDQPMRWQRPRRIFVCAHSDLFFEGVPKEWIDKVFAVMAMAPQHTFQVLTKRPERMLNYIVNLDTDEAIERISDVAVDIADSPCAPGIIEDATMIALPNVCYGVSVENQETADKRIPFLLSTPAAFRWISAEPLLGRIDLRVLYYDEITSINALSKNHDLFLTGQRSSLDWVVVGGESGTGYRDMKHEWARNIRDQCKFEGVPFFMKQMAGKKTIPQDLLVRENPELPILQ